MPQRVREGSDAHFKPKSTTQKPMSSVATRHFQKKDLAGVTLQPTFWQEQSDLFKIYF
jgi:hypothetical protein